MLEKKVNLVLGIFLKVLDHCDADIVGVSWSQTLGVYVRDRLQASKYHIERLIGFDHANCRSLSNDIKRR